MSGASEHQAKAAASQFRHDHRLGVQPLGDLVAVIEQTTGHDVAVLDAEPDEHGLTMRDPARGRVFIGVARTKNPMRQRSTLAHELAHLVFEDSAEVLSERSPEEVRADAFARHLLIPSDGIREVLDDVRDIRESDLSDIVQRFLVSPAIAAIAMRDAGVISPELADEWRSWTTPQLATRYGWRDFYASLQADSDRLRAPQGLVSRATAGYVAGVVSVQMIAALRAVSVERIETELSEAGIRRRPPQVDDFVLADLPDVDVDLSGLDEFDEP